MARNRLFPSCLVLPLLLPAAAAGAAEAPTRPPDPYAALEYRFVGPPGNRVSAVVGVPGDPNTYYAGAASGGVWKSTDGGTHWKPIFDDQPAQSIGAIAIAPSDPNVVWVGTGESFIRSNVSLGNGVYRSTDAGQTWTHVGLEKTGRISRVVVDPRDPDVAFVAALGTCYGPQQERGVFRTRDGGRTWQRVLFVDEMTGASDLSMDATNPRNLFAGMWPIEIKTWGRTSGGPGGGVYVSRDGGSSWKRIEGHGLPAPPIGKVAVAVAPSDPRRVYALIETGQRGSLWRSDDGGEKWKRVNASRLLNERPHYYTRMLVMPDDAGEVYFPSNGMGATWDGGETAEPIRWGGDNHDMWADPRDPRRMMIGNDGGVQISTTRGRQWSFVRLPIGQMYHVATDDRVPYMVYGQMQDDGSMRGPSNSRSGRRIHPALWTTTAGCETGWNVPDPVDPDVVWGGCYAGVVERFDARTGLARSVSVWPERTMGAPAGEVKLRMNWTFPIALSPHDHQTAYVGSQYVHATSDGGQTWRTISPDLTLNDRSTMRLRRADRGQPLGRVRGRRLLGRRVAAREGRDLGRDQRRPGAGDARRRPALDERHGPDPRPAAEGHGVERRAEPLRPRRLLRRRRPPPGRQPRSLPLRDVGLRQDLEVALGLDPEDPAELRARATREPAPARPALRGHGERRLRLLG